MLLCFFSAQRGRIYLPRDELAQFGLGEDDIFAGQVTDKWRAFMKDQIKRARVLMKLRKVSLNSIKTADGRCVICLS